jgi:hypothetical protein
MKKHENIAQKDQQADEITVCYSVVSFLLPLSEGSVGQFLEKGAYNQ